MSLHTPVLLNESIDYLVTKKNGIYFDGTAGFGGHSEKILEKINSNGKLIATDKDPKAFQFTGQVLQTLIQYLRLSSLMVLTAS